MLAKGRGLEYNDSNDMETIRITKIIRTGNGLCVVIPKNILQALHMERGDQVCFGIIDDYTLAIRKITSKDLSILKPPHENI